MGGLSVTRAPILLDWLFIMPENTDRQPNRAPWIALLLAVAALLSNAGFFVAIPGQRALAWLGVILVIAAIVCAVIGIMRVFRQPQVYRGKISSSILGVLSLLICAFIAFLSIHARDLPQAIAAPQVGQKVPDFTLADTNGNKVSLGQLLGKDRITIAAAPSEVMESLRKANKLPPAMAGVATPPKAVLLVFYRGYW